MVQFRFTFTNLPIVTFVVIEQLAQMIEPSPISASPIHAVPWSMYLTGFHFLARALFASCFLSSGLPTAAIKQISSSGAHSILSIEPNNFSFASAGQEAVGITTCPYLSDSSDRKP